MRIRNSIMAFGVVFGLSGIAQAGIIVDVVNGVVGGGEIVVEGPGGALVIPEEIDEIVDEVIPNNDNFSMSFEEIADRLFEGVELENPIVVLKFFDAAAPIDAVLRAEDTGGVTEYFIFDLVLNRTALTWSDYHIELGFGVGEEFIPFASGGLDFDTPDKDPIPQALSAEEFLAAAETDPLVLPPSLFAALSHMNGGIWWEEGLLPPAAHDEDFALFTFSFDVPDASAVPDFARVDNGYLFTIRQYPTLPPPPVIPEPSSLGLIGMGLFGLSAASRRRAKSAPARTLRKNSEDL